MRTVAELAGVSANQATVVMNRPRSFGLVERPGLGCRSGPAGPDNEAARAVLAWWTSNTVLARLAGEREDPASPGVSRGIRFVCSC